MKGPKALFESENNLVTEMGAWFPGERVVFRGKDLHHDLGDMSWMDLYLYGITGRTFGIEEIKIFNSMWVLTSYPDPRLWNNRVAALSTSSRSTGILGMAAAVAVSEAAIYGARPEIQAHDLLTRLKEQSRSGESNIESLMMVELKRSRVLPGFGRPVTQGDERLEPLMDALKSSNIAVGGHLQLAKNIENALAKKRYPYRLNFAGATAAIAADLGLTAREFYLFGALGFVAGMIPVLHLGNQKAPGAFFPTRCAAIESETKSVRVWSGHGG